MRNRIKIAVLLVVSFANIAFCSTKLIDSGQGTVEYNFLNESISNGSYLEKTFSYVGNQKLALTFLSLKIQNLSAF